jgi:hypothetical protein
MLWKMSPEGSGVVLLHISGYLNPVFRSVDPQHPRNGKLWEILTDGSGHTREVAANSAGDTANTEPELAGGERSDNLALSPDRSWVAYSPRRGFALNAQPVTGANVPRQIATNGYYPVWRADGKEILYLDRDRSMVMSVAVKGSGKDLSFGVPQALFPENSALRRQVLVLEEQFLVHQPRYIRQ